MGIALSGLSLLIAITLVLTASLLIGWFNFGRMRYVLLWSIAAGGEALQWVINAAAPVDPNAAALPLFVSALLSIADCTLVALGCYNRAGRTAPVALLALPAGVATLVLGWAMFSASPPDIAVRGGAANLHAALMFMIGAQVVRPRDRPANIAEYATIGAALLFIAYAIALAAVWLGVGGIGDADPTLRSTTLLVGLPVAYVSVGVAAILLIASDLYERLQALATRDPLTGALNRRGLEQAMVPALANARRRQQPLALIVIDVGGGTEGEGRQSRARDERLLVTAADALNAAIREEDVFGHLGGGEFCVALIETSVAEAAAVARRMQAAFEALAVAGISDATIVPAFGIAQTETGDMAVGSLIRRARDAMIAARAARGAGEAGPAT